MNILLQQLAQAIKKYPCQEKLLVVPSHNYGYQLMAGLASRGRPGLICARSPRWGWPWR